MLARQVVAEKLSATRGSLPAGIDPVMAPASSIMGEIMFVGLTGAQDVTGGELRDAAEWLVRRRLLGVPGIAQVVPIGGDVKQVEIVLAPDRLMQHRVGAAHVLDALEKMSASAPGGFYVGGSGGVPDSRHRPDRVARRAEAHGGRRARRRPDPARGRRRRSLRRAIRRGEAALDGKHGVVLKVQKQPQANTLELTGRVDAALDDIATVAAARHDRSTARAFGRPTSSASRSTTS